MLLSLLNNDHPIHQIFCKLTDQPGGKSQGFMEPPKPWILSVLLIEVFVELWLLNFKF